MSKRMSSKIEYTCKGKGGRYEILGLATGAGLTRGEDRLIYKDASTGRLFLRTEADFSDRMERLRDVAAPVVERQPPHQIHDCCANCMHGNDAHTDDGRCPAPYTTVWHAWDYNFAPDDAPPELAELQAENSNLRLQCGGMKTEIAELRAELERLKGGQGEPVAYTVSSKGDVYWCAEGPLPMGTNLYTSQPAPVSVADKYDDVLIPFVAMMRAELHANAGKGDRPGWLEMDRKTALLEIFYHVGKLQKAVKNGDQAGIGEYAADVANMSMMLADVCDCLDKDKELNQ